MNTKLLLLCAIVTIAIVNSYGQIDTFDLSKYKVADYERHQLNISFNAFGNGDINRSNSDTMYQKNKGYGFQSSLDLSYRSIFINRKFEREFGLSTLLSPMNLNYTKNSKISENGYYEETKSNNNFSNIWLSMFFNNKKYYTGNFFIKTGISSFYNYSRYNNKHDFENLPDYSNKYHSHRISNFLKLGIGKGRIENVEDARMAVFILNDLYNAQRLSRKPSEDEILEFAEKITKLLNKRYFDYRIHRIYEIQAIDSFLRDKNLIKETDALHYATIMDNWSFSNNPYRYSGKRISIDFSPVYVYHFYKTTHTNADPEIQKVKSQEAGININTEWLNTKPISLKWQRDYSIQVGYSKNWHWYTFDNIADDNYDQIAAIISYKLGYYPNSRTYCTLDINSSLYKYWFTPSQESYSDISLQSGLSFDLYYYISPQFRIYALAGIQYTQNKYPGLPFKDGDYSFRPSFSVQFAYSIF